MDTTEYYDSGAYEDIHYRGFLSFFTSAYHRQLEKKWRVRDSFSKVLEIGGGSGEHFPFVKHRFDSYISLDLGRRNSKLSDPRIVFTVGNAKAIPFPDSYFDRALSTCVLHHIPEPHKALRELRRVTREGGVIDLYIPHDPGMIYRRIRHIFSHYKQSKTAGIPLKNVKYLWSSEHPNHFLGLKYAIQEVFGNDEIREIRKPIPFLSWNFNLYSIFRIRIQEK